MWDFYTVLLRLLIFFFEEKCCPRFLINVDMFKRPLIPGRKTKKTRSNIARVDGLAF